MSTSSVLCTIVRVWFSIYPCLSSYNSTKATTIFPGDDQAMAVAYDNTTNTILLFGGRNNPQSFIQFRNNDFVFTDTVYLTTEQASFGYGQHYVQQHDQLFMHAAGDTIITFLTRPPYQSSLNPINIPIPVDNMNSCLAIRDHYLFVAGGGDGGNGKGFDTVQIYDISSGHWLSGVPSLDSPRRNPGCLVMNDVLYVIGGRHSTTYTSTIQTLNVSDADIASISQPHVQWQYFSDTLSKGVSNVKLVGYRTDIIVIGGQTKSTTTMRDVHVMDTIAGTCRVMGSLDVKTECPGVIVHKPSNTLFIFGGYPSSSFDTWQYILLPTPEPTPQPSEPTRIPTIDPTSNPSYPIWTTSDPTVDPTNDPINDATNDLTVLPTVNPTRYPTKDPNTVSVETNNHNEDWMLSIEMTVVSILLLLTCVALVYVIKYRKGQMQNEEDVSNVASDLEVKKMEDDIVNNSSPQMEDKNAKMNVILQPSTAGLGSTAGHVINARIVMHGSAKVTKGQAANKEIVDPDPDGIEKERDCSSSSSDLYDNNLKIELQTSGNTVREEVECNAIETAGEGLEGAHKTR